MENEKLEQMKKIKDELLVATNSPLYSYRHENGYFPVIGEGNHDARVVFIGEAPGENEAKTGRPFCGRAGKFLDELLELAGIDRSTVYITNIIKDRPPGNRDPEPEEIKFYGPYLDRQLEVIQPSIIVTLGRFSMKYILEKYDLGDAVDSMGKIHGNIYDVQTLFGEIKIIPLHHPAASLYSGETKEILKQDFKRLKDMLK